MTCDSTQKDLTLHAPKRHFTRHDRSGTVNLKQVRLNHSNSNCFDHIFRTAMKKQDITTKQPQTEEITLTTSSSSSPQTKRNEDVPRNKSRRNKFLRKKILGKKNARKRIPGERITHQKGGNYSRNSRKKHTKKGETREDTSLRITFHNVHLSYTNKNNVRKKKKTPESQE